uniref:Ig-like domain-containing protein n=1 Tax=Chelonoidis abingdonii TaxID=106734 RepID=A0A8C0FVW4_CHEAB
MSVIGGPCLSDALSSFLSLTQLLGFSVPEKFSLAGSPHPMVGVIGQDMVLPCQLSPPAPVPSMEVLWRKIGSEYILVHKYSDEGSRDLPGESYQTRTELFQQEFSSGNISLKLKQLQVADAGTYQCLVRNPGWSQEAIAELRVAAVAPVFIDVLGPQGQGIGLACRVTGWFPKPELQWVGKNWQNLAMETVTSLTQDRENLYSVVSHVTVTEGEENGDISCIVRNGLLETERQSAIHLSGESPPEEWVTMGMHGEKRAGSLGNCTWLGTPWALTFGAPTLHEEEAGGEVGYGTEAGDRQVSRQGGEEESSINHPLPPAPPDCQSASPSPSLLPFLPSPTGNQLFCSICRHCRGRSEGSAHLGEGMELSMKGWGQDWARVLKLVDD